MKTNLNAIFENRLHLKALTDVVPLKVKKSVFWWNNFKYLYINELI